MSDHTSMQSCKSEPKSWKILRGALMHAFMAPWKCNYDSMEAWLHGRSCIYLLIHACFSMVLHTELYLCYFCSRINPNYASSRYLCLFFLLVFFLRSFLFLSSFSPSLFFLFFFLFLFCLLFSPFFPFFTIFY